MKNDKKTAVGYIRVSTEEQTLNYSLEYQEEHIRDYCRDNDINLLHMYNEGFGSGTNVEDREVFKEMLANCLQNDGIDFVIVLADHRFARNHADAIHLTQRLIDSGTNLICIADRINTNNRSDYDYFKNKSIFSERHRDEIVFSLTYGMRQRAKNGEHNGGRLLGYTTINGKLIIDPEGSKTVKKIFELYTIEEWGYRKIAQYLNKHHYKTINNGEFSTHAIKTILTNPTYNGFTRYEGKLFDGIHEPIIDNILWEKTQQTLKLRSFIPEKIHHGSYFLTGLLKCPKCNGSMVHHVSGRGKYRYYQCNNNKNGKNCKANAVKKEYAEEYTISLLSSIINSPNITSLLLQRMKVRISNEVKDLKETIARLKRDIKKIESQIEKTYNLYYKDENELHFMQIEKLNNHYRSLLDKLKKTENQCCSLVNKNVTHIVNDFLANFERNFHLYDDADKKLLLKSIFNEIQLNKGDSIRERTIREVSYTVDIDYIPQLLGA